ncbi:hypothetical protein BB561_004725 [Smittium simulii]|uniref:CTLH domain-containing protein n=1 Tax=Smittium simulii TaxID=133385 RepID=A0A2T9YEL5_9FUNG|nr:hypothetical protein BB561_004725 [Smittium simulii]
MTETDKPVLITKKEWEKKMQESEISTLDMNKLIMEYLVIEGYKEAAENFSSETGLAPCVDLETIQERMLIRNSIQNGNIQAATELVNELNCELLETEPELFFKLKQQQLIELIREGKIEEALEFAQEELAVKGEEFPELLPELEKTMALFAVDLNSCSNSSPKLSHLDSAIAHNPDIPEDIEQLLGYKQRQKLASKLNSALLAAQNQPSESRLPSLLYLLVWSQKLLQSDANFPKIVNFFTGDFEYPSEPSSKKPS